MEEKILISGNQYDGKRLFKILRICAIIFIVLSLIVSFAWRVSYYQQSVEKYNKHKEQEYCWYSYGRKTTNCSYCQMATEYASGFEYACTGLVGRIIFYGMCYGALVLILRLISRWINRYELTVSDKRIFGKTATGKRVDLPIDSVSATSTTRLFKGVSISTSSGRISFRFLKNADEVYQIINNLLIERQNMKTKTTPVVSAPVTDEADQLKKYKDLLDAGAITQEEFDAKKKQLLGL